MIWHCLKGISSNIYRFLTWCSETWFMYTCIIIARKCMKIVWSCCRFSYLFLYCSWSFHFDTHLQEWNFRLFCCTMWRHSEQSCFHPKNYPSILYISENFLVFSVLILVFSVFCKPYGFSQIRNSSGHW